MANPREPGSVRRISEQVIMWLILGGTVGAAAFVDQRINRLGGLQRIGNVTLRLPATWKPTPDHGPSRVELREQGDEHFSRVITVAFEDSSFSLEDWISAGPGDGQEGETVRLSGGRTARVEVARRSLESVYRVKGIGELEVTAIVSTPGGRNLLITIGQLSLGGRGDVETNQKLMRRILATLRFT